MAWWDSRHYRASGSSWSAPSPMRRRDRSIVHGIARLENAPLEMDEDTDGVLFPIVEEENIPVTNPALLVNVSINFTDPIIRSRYHRTYASSPAFAASDRVCRGLLRRIEHCCEELMTRKDPEALDMFTNDTSTVKRQRYEMTFQITRKGGAQWAEKTFRSYQKQPLTVGFTKEVILASDKMVGLFLRHHDRGFRWFDGSVHDDYQEPQTVAASEDGPQLLCCVPEPRFNETSQSFDMVPGYTIMLSFRSRTKRPARTEFGKVLKVHSEQDTPLNLELGEELLSYVWKSVLAYMETKRHEFDEEHTCYEGVSDPDSATACPHLDDDAARVDVRVSNNLGPAYDHLQREYHSQVTIFREEDLQDCLEFVRFIEHEMLDARDHADYEISQKEDLELRVLELKSPTWSISEPYVVKLDHWVTRPRRTIEAILDRVQTGISEVLHGNNLTVHIVAYKRGHLVMDKTLVARQARDNSKKRATITQLQKEELVLRLRSRIRQDIDKVCKDTCLLEEEAPQDDPFLDATGLHYISDELPTEEPDVGHILGDSIQLTPKLAPVRSLRRTFSMMARPVSRRASRPEFKVDRESEHQQSGSRPVTPSTPTGSIRSSYTGTGSPRAFPLLPARYPLHSPTTTSITGVSHVLEPEQTCQWACSTPETGKMASLDEFRDSGHAGLPEPTATTALHDVPIPYQASAGISHVQDPAGSQTPHVTDSMGPPATTEIIPASPGLLSNEPGSATNQPSEASSKWDSSSDDTTDEDGVVGLTTCKMSGEDDLREALPVNTPLDLPQALLVQHDDHVQALDAKVADVVLQKRPVADDTVDTFTPSSTTPQSCRTNTDSWAEHNSVTTPIQDRNWPCPEHADVAQVHKGLSTQAKTYDSQGPLLLCPETIATTNTSEPSQPESDTGLDDKVASSFEDRNVAVYAAQETGDSETAHVEEHHALPVEQDGSSSIVEDTTENETTTCHKHDSVIADTFLSPPSPFAELPSEEQTLKIVVAEVAGKHERDPTASTANGDQSPHILEEGETMEGIYAHPPDTTTGCSVLHPRSVMSDMPVTRPRLAEILGGEDDLSVPEGSVLAQEGNLFASFDVCCVLREAMTNDNSVEVERSVTPVDESSATASTGTQSYLVDLPVSPPHVSALPVTEDDTFVAEDVQLDNEEGSIDSLLEPDLAGGDEDALAREEEVLQGEKGIADKPWPKLSSEGIMPMPEAQEATSTEHSSSAMQLASEHGLIIKPLSLIESSPQQASKPAEIASAARDYDPVANQLSSSTTMCKAEGLLDLSLVEARKIQSCRSAEPHDKLALARGDSPTAVEAVNYAPDLARILVEPPAAADKLSAPDEPVAESVILAGLETSSEEGDEAVVAEESIEEALIATAGPAAAERFTPTTSTESSGLNPSFAADVDESGAFEAATAVKEAAPLLAETATPGNNAAIVEGIAVVDEIVPAQNAYEVDQVVEEPAKAIISDMMEMTKIEDEDMFEAEILGMANPMLEEFPVEEVVATDNTLPFEERYVALEAVGKGTSMSSAPIVGDEEQLSVSDVDSAEDQNASEVPRSALESIEAPLMIQDVDPNQENGSEKWPSVCEEEATIVPEEAAKHEHTAEGVLTGTNVIGPAAGAQPPCDTSTSVRRLAMMLGSAEKEPPHLESSAPEPDASLEPSHKEPATQEDQFAIAASSDSDEEVTALTLPEQMFFDELKANATNSLAQVQNFPVEESQHPAETQDDGVGGKLPTSAVEDSVRTLHDSWAHDSVRVNETEDSVSFPVFANLPRSSAPLKRQSVSKLGATGPGVDQSLSSNLMTVVRTQDVVNPDITFQPRCSSQVQPSHIEGCPESSCRGRRGSQTDRHVESPEHGFEAQAQVSVISGVTPAAEFFMTEERPSSEAGLTGGALGECQHDAGIVQRRPSYELPRTESNPFPPDRPATTTHSEAQPGFEVSASLISDDFALPDIKVGEHGSTSNSSGPGTDLKAASMARGKDSSIASQAPATPIWPSMSLGSQAARQGEVEGTISAAPEGGPLDVDGRMVLDTRNEQGDVGSETSDATYENGEAGNTPKDDTATKSVADTAHDVPPQTALTVKRDACKDEHPTDTCLIPADEAADAVVPTPETTPVVVHKSFLGPAPVALTIPWDQTGPSAEEAANMTKPTFNVPLTIQEDNFGWTHECGGRQFGEEIPQKIMEKLLYEGATITRAPGSGDQPVLDAVEGVHWDETGVILASDEISESSAESSAGETCVEIDVIGGEALEDKAAPTGKAAQQEGFSGEDTSEKVVSELPTSLDVTEHALEAAVAPCHVKDQAISEVPEHTGVDRVNPAVFAALPTSLPPANVTRAEHGVEKKVPESVEPQNTVEELPLEFAEDPSKVQTQDSSLASPRCSVSGETGASRLHDDQGIPGSCPEVSASKAVDNSGDEIAYPPAIAGGSSCLQVENDPCEEDMAVDFHRSSAVREDTDEENVGLETMARGAEQDLPEPGQLVPTDTAAVMQLATSAEPGRVMPAMRLELSAAIPSRHTPSPQPKHGDGVPQTLERNELHHGMDARCKDFVPTGNLKLFDAVAEKSLVAKTKAMTGALLSLTEDPNQQTLTPETAHACGTLPKTASLPHDLRPECGPVGALVDRLTPKTYASRELSGSGQCDAPISAPNDGLTTSSTLSSQSHDSSSSYAASFVSGRDSVDTYAPSIVGDLPDQEAETDRDYCPPTAGWLGLHQPICRPRRFSMSLPCPTEHSMVCEAGSRPATACSTSTVKPPRRKDNREAPTPLRANAAMATTDTARGPYDKRNIVPRMVILIAGLAIAGRMFNADRH
ncbi:hypothetical protein DL546_001731 [Coniochaeta pulveracea]|uniref:Pt repeat family protein n=1 Tax=Coniochaeta pulveracea TaxID=177199 RepID=A0A420XYB2_9PEZI|nr:hypothetical protein DL546_001731 [Coniochaeta pulveracea]